MNLQHLKYAIEVEKTGSITQAAENLFMNQPNLSKAIRELETLLGITVFHRSPKGVTPTAEGEEFLGYAHSILSQVEKMEAHYTAAGESRQVLRLSIPRSSYIASAFTAFVASLNRGQGFHITFSEVGTLQAIKNLLEENYHIGIIRYQTIYESYFLRFLQDRNVEWRDIWEFDSQILMSCDHPLAQCGKIKREQLCDCIEITHGDLSIPNLAIKGQEEQQRRIYVRERGSQLDLLARIPETYMWVSPMPKDLLERNHLVVRRCEAPEMHQKDVLIYQRGHVFGSLEESFLQKVEEAKAQVQQDIP